MSTAIATPPAKKLMTADEFWVFVNRPENEDRSFELIQGRVSEMSRPSRLHGAVASNLTFALMTYARTQMSGYVVNESGVILSTDPDTVRGPDVAFYTDAKRLSDLPVHWGTSKPVLAVEVLSPNDRPGQVNAKIRDYLTNGIRMVWIVDCDDRSISVYRPNAPFEIFSEGQELTGGSELPGFQCPVSEFFHLPGETVAPS